MIDYSKITIEELTTFIIDGSPQSVTMARQYHKKAGHTDIVEKIDIARFRAKLLKAELKLQKMREFYESESNTTTGSC